MSNQPEKFSMRTMIIAKYVIEAQFLLDFDFGMGNQVVFEEYG